MNEPDDRVADLLRVLLGDESGMLDFATAVAIHLRDASPNGRAEDEVVARVVEVLAPFRDADEPPAAESLLDDPELLASFFQNADLLDPAAPETPGVARLVMTALERVSDEV